MAGFRPSDRAQRLKAAGAVVAVHLGLGAALVIGLNVETISRTVERLRAFDIEEVPPPPDPPPPPVRMDDEPAPRDEAAPENLRAEPSPVVAPESPFTPPIPLPAAEVAGTGSDRQAGAGDRPGPGTGAGGEGSGRGGGGTGGSGGGLGREARLLGGHRARLGRTLLQEAGVSRGQIPLRLSIAPNGRVSGCTPLATSGSQKLDAELCRIMRSRSRWAPALDRAGRPVPVELTYIATFSG